MNWPRRSVRVRVPATSANLGPGFDALGLALALHDKVEAEVTGSGLAVEVSGQGAEEAAAGERHLVVRAMRAGFAATVGGQPPGLALRCTNAIPQGRGLGSSAGAVVAGLLAARSLAGPESPERSGSGAAAAGIRGPEALTDDALLALAAELEGHADNAAACLAGGLTVAWNPGTGPRAVRLESAAGHRARTLRARGVDADHGGQAGASAGRPARRRGRQRGPGRAARRRPDPGP